MLDAIAFEQELQQLATGEDATGRVASFVERATNRRIIYVKLPSLEADRLKVIKAIQRAELRVINVVVARLRSDVARLTPFENDSPEVRAQKQEIARNEGREINRLEREARQEVQSGSTLVPSGEHRDVYHPGTAMRQLVDEAKGKKNELNCQQFNWGCPHH